MNRSVANTSSSTSPEGADRMPIEELARRTGVTVRNLRAMQARSLIDPPELVGRKGYYTERHVSRVLLVLKLQSRGFSLAAIQELIKGWQKGAGILDVMGLEDALLTPGTSSPSGEARVEDVFPELLEHPWALSKAIEQDAVVERDGVYVAPNGELLSIVRQQMKAGFPLDDLMAAGDALIEDVDRIAARFRASFFEHIVNPQLDAGADGANLAEVASKVEQLRPLTVRLVSILLARAIERGGGEPSHVDGPAKKARKTSRSSAKPATKVAAKSTQTSAQRRSRSARGTRKRGAR